MEFDLKSSLYMEDLADKVIFWDIDGVLAPYRFNGHVGVLDTYDGMTREEVMNDIFILRKPSKYVRSIAMSCKARRHVVCGHVLYAKEMKDKEVWLDEHYPFIKDRLFIQCGDSKAIAILDYCGKNGINLNDVLFIDDRLDILREAESKGINAWHISSLMDALC